MKFDFASRILRSPEGEGASAGGDGADPAPQASGDPAPTPAGDPPADPPADPPPGEPDPEPTVPMSVFQRRINQLTAQKAKLEGDLALAKATPAGAGQSQDGGSSAAPSGLTQADVESRAAELAARREFDARCNAVIQAGQKAHPDFMTKLQHLQLSAGGQLPPSFIETLLETDDPAKVIHALGGDVAKATEILDLPPAKQAIALAKFEVELAKKIPAKPKVSKAPEPITPQVTGAGGTESGTLDVTDTSLPIKEWMAARKAQLKAARTRA